MKVVFEIRDCTVKSSPACTGTFQRELKRGRPPVACIPCRTIAKVVKVSPVSAEKVPASLERTCPCGSTFQANPGRGRKATKCVPCREAGTVYRANDDGVLEAIRAETIAEEQRERAVQAGQDRAERLCQMMQPILAKRNRLVMSH
jgi:hypothetical protein